MLIVTANELKSRDYEELGLVSGSTVQSKNLARDFGAGLKSIVGGELKDYTLMMEEARTIALKRMEEKAVSLGADAVIAMQFSSSAIASGAAEIIAYGTAIKFK